MTQLDLIEDIYKETLQNMEKRIAQLEMKMILCFPAKIYDLEKSYERDKEKSKQTMMAI